MLACAGLLESTGLARGLQRSAVNAGNFIRRFSWSMSQITLKMCAAVKNCEKFTKNRFLKGSRSFKIIDVDKSIKPVTSAFMISSMYVLICSRFHIIRANNSKMTSFQGGTPLWRPRSRRTPAPSGTKFCHDKLETLGQSIVKISWS